MLNVTLNDNFCHLKNNGFVSDVTGYNWSDCNVTQCNFLGWSRERMLDRMMNLCSIEYWMTDGWV